MHEKTQLVSDLQGLIRSANANGGALDCGTLVGLQWGLGSIRADLLAEAIAAVTEPAVVVRYEDPLLKVLSEDGTEEIASLEVGHLSP